MNICPHCLAAFLMGMGFAAPFVKDCLKRLALWHSLHRKCKDKDCCMK